MDLDLRGLGSSEIARQLEMTPSHVSIITNSGPYQHEISIRRAQLDAMNAQRIVDSNDEVASAIREKTLAAARRLGLVIDTGKDNDAIRAAEAILDRGGYPRVTKTEDKSVRINIDAADLARLTETLEMLGPSASADKPTEGTLTLPEGTLTLPQDQQGPEGSVAHGEKLAESGIGSTDLAKPTEGTAFPEAKGLEEALND